MKCVTSGDVGSGVAECDPQSICNPRKKTFGALKPGFRSLATLKLVVNVVGKL